MFVRLSVRESSSLKWWWCVMWRCMNVSYQAHGNARLKPRARMTNMLQRNWDVFDSTATLYLVATRFLSSQKLLEISGQSTNKKYRVCFRTMTSTFLPRTAQAHTRTCTHTLRKHKAQACAGTSHPKRIQTL